MPNLFLYKNEIIMEGEINRNKKQQEIDKFKDNIKKKIKNDFIENYDTNKSKMESINSNLNVLSKEIYGQEEKYDLYDYDDYCITTEEIVNDYVDNKMNVEDLKKMNSNQKEYIKQLRKEGEEVKEEIKNIMKENLTKNYYKKMNEELVLGLLKNKMGEGDFNKIEPMMREVVNNVTKNKIQESKNNKNK